MKASKAISSRTESPAAPARKRDSSSATERFRLNGPSPDLDPRYDAWRPDLADVALAARLFAPHYAKPLERRIGAAPSSLHVKPDVASEMLANLDAGEVFALLDIAGGWAWGYRQSDHLVGYMRADALDV